MHVDFNGPKDRSWPNGNKPIVSLANDSCKASQLTPKTALLVQQGQKMTAYFSTSKPDYYRQPDAKIWYQSQTAQYPNYFVPVYLIDVR